MKPFMSLAVCALVVSAAGAARADQGPELLDQSSAGFAIEAHWKARHTWAPHARLPIAVSGGRADDALSVQHLRDGAPWGEPQRCGATTVSSDLVVFECAALDSLNTQELGARGMALSYVRDGHEDESFVTVFYDVDRFQRSAE